MVKPGALHPGRAQLASGFTSVSPRREANPRSVRRWARQAETILGNKCPKKRHFEYEDQIKIRKREMKNELNAKNELDRHWSGIEGSWEIHV
ncbi:hypothetical protein [Roseovarius sp.]|uniref:hypothetical protein n=1 Tax=Roseovarius sp. TaxID=1486281 RepID=UPI002605988F|nr:hypothetical protein [Roseovarius sp.]